MKKKIITLILGIVLAFALMGADDCTGNRLQVDSVNRFDEAIIQLPDGEILRGKVESWTDFSDGDQLQIRIDGVWYLVHSANAVLISYSYEQTN